MFVWLGVLGILVGFSATANLQLTLKKKALVSVCALKLADETGSHRIADEIPGNLIVQAYLVLGPQDLRLSRGIQTRIRSYLKNQNAPIEIIDEMVRIREFGNVLYFKVQASEVQILAFAGAPAISKVRFSSEDLRRKGFDRGDKVPEKVSIELADLLPLLTSDQQAFRVQIDFESSFDQFPSPLQFHVAELMKIVSWKAGGHSAVVMITRENLLALIDIPEVKAIRSAQD